MGVRVVVGVVGGIAVLAVFLSWFDARVATRIERRVERATGLRFGPSSKRNAKRSPGPGLPRSRRSSGLHGNEKPPR